MDLENVVELLKLMESHGLDEVEIEQDNMRIRLKKGGVAQIAPTVIAASAPLAAGNGLAAAANPAAAPAADEKAPAEDVVEVPSPMVGTFYRSPAPDADLFVQEGDHVTADSVVCIIEAMKVMNEIKAECEGEVVRILVENGESVEYGQPLMVIRTGAAPE